VYYTLITPKYVHDIIYVHVVSILMQIGLSVFSIATHMGHPEVCCEILTARPPSRIVLFCFMVLNGSVSWHYTPLITRYKFVK